MQVILTTAFFVVVTWNWWQWKGIVALVPFWTLFEFVYRLRLRGYLACPHCGFDANLFMVDQNRAREEVKRHVRKKYEERGINLAGVESASASGLGSRSTSRQVPEALGPDAAR